MGLALGIIVRLFIRHLHIPESKVNALSEIYYCLSDSVSREIEL